MLMEEKLCPYCYKSIKGNYGSAEDDLTCPHPNCGKKIPKIYLQYPNKHVVSIINKKCTIKDFGYEVADFAKNNNAEGAHSRAEYYESADENVQIVLFEYLKEESSARTETVVLAIHKCVLNSNERLPASDIEYASAILLNIDISELKALYFNLGIDRSPEEFKKWQPRNTGILIREVSDYLRRNQLSRKVAVLFGNLQYIGNHPYVYENQKYKNLLEITRDWTSNSDDRKWMAKANDTVRDLLLELGEERLIKDADTMSGTKFFLFPSSKYRMTSNTFWMMGILLWICTKID